MTAVLLAVLVSQCSYVRSRTDDSKAQSQCLWWHDNGQVVFHQSADGNPETPGDTEHTAVSRAFGTWQAQLSACGNFSIAEGARTASRRIGYDDGSASNENVVLFRQRKCTTVAPSNDACWQDDDCGNAYDCWQHSAAAIAITTTSYHATIGRIYDSDIELNTPSYIFSTVDAPACSPPALPYSTSCVATDVQNTVTHEVGHFVGLGHISTQPGSTMSPRADPGELTKRVLDCGSQAFICDAYPAGQPSRGCVVLAASFDLGKPKTGCQAAPGGLIAGSLALLALLRRRRR